MSDEAVGLEPPARLPRDRGRMLAVFAAYVALQVRDYEGAHGDLPRAEVIRSMAHEATRVAEMVEEACGV